MNDTERKPQTLNVAIAAPFAFLIGCFGILALIVGLSGYWKDWASDIIQDGIFSPILLQISWLSLVSFIPLWCSTLLFEAILYRRKGFTVYISDNLTRSHNIISLIILLPAFTVLFVLGAAASVYFTKMITNDLNPSVAGVIFCTITILGAFASIHALRNIIRYYYGKRNAG